MDNLSAQFENEHDVWVSAPTTGPSPVHQAPVSPAARRPQASSWRDPRLVIGIVIVAVSVVLGAKLLGGADDTVGVWAVREAMSRGATVGTGDLVRRDLGFAGSADADRYLSADVGVPAGSTLSRDVGAGELLPRAALGNGPEQSLVEVPLSVDSGSVPSTVRVGSVVDVWVTPTKVSANSRSAPAELVFDDVTVVSAPRPRDSLGPSSPRQVIVGVGPADATALPQALAALVSGTVIVTKRG